MRTFALVVALAMGIASSLPSPQCSRTFCSTVIEQLVINDAVTQSETFTLCMDSDTLNWKQVMSDGSSTILNSEENKLYIITADGECSVAPPQGPLAAVVCRLNLTGLLFRFRRFLTGLSPEQLSTPPPSLFLSRFSSSLHGVRSLHARWSLRLADSDRCVAVAVRVDLVLVVAIFFLRLVSGLEVSHLFLGLRGRAFRAQLHVGEDAKDNKHQAVKGQVPQARMLSALLDLHHCRLYRLEVTVHGFHETTSICMYISARDVLVLGTSDHQLAQLNCVWCGDSKTKVVRVK
jgi:hypothetical protein